MDFLFHNFQDTQSPLHRLNEMVHLSIRLFLL